MMRRKLPLLVLLGSIYTFTACKKADINFGSEYIDNESTQIVKVDTFGVSLSTVVLDSFSTSAKGVTLIGGYNDPVFGRIDSKSFFEVTPDNYTSDKFPITATFDSLELILKLNNHYYGDTTQLFHLDVYKLAEKIVPPNNGYALYNTDSFKVSTLLGSKDVVVNPTRNPADTISVRLSDNLGRAFLKKLIDLSDIDLKTSSDFIQYFNGLRLSSSVGGNLVLGCTDNITMRLHYKSLDLYNANKIFDFTITDKSHQFNYITVNRAGTILKDLQKQRELVSTVTNNAAYTQSISGAMIKMRFPNLRDILIAPNFGKVIKAQLVVRPVKNTYSKLYALPPQLRLSLTTILNNLGSDLRSTNNNGVSEVQTGAINIDYLYGDNTTYTYDLSNYVKILVSDPSISLNGLLLTPPSPAFESQLNRVVIGDRNNAISSKIELQIYYVAIK